MEEESRGVVLGAERLDVAGTPLEPSPSTALVAAVAAECSPLVPAIPPTVLLMLLPMLGMLAKWLMLLLLLLLLLWVEWSAEAEGCDDANEPDEGARELALLLSTLVYVRELEPRAETEE